ncbi:MAG: iron export ABC transporter permease subunit FetB [Gammaproteobacteria bacterium]|nr:iron export ABC transporter permease subunit FetB [Gammaproteobacteria bacterium]MCF6259360.1 iron export ABC transporter permease subunit FetB [Gammaproteobacteria bacterium]
MITLSAVDLSLAAGLVLAMAALSWRMQLGLSGQLLIAGTRTVVQLLLIGLVLKALFANVDLLWVTGISLVMLLAAGREVMARQQRRFTGWWGFGMGTGAMFISSFAITVLALTTMVATDPWYDPQYAVPLLGMLLGNTMSGIALALDRLTTTAWQQRAIIEQRLMLGAARLDAIAEIRREAMRSGMMPIINSMAAAGLVSLPGMMTGQILAGSPPLEAVKYQILIMFLISAGTGFGVTAALWLASKRLFDDRDRLRLDKLSGPRR